MGKFQKEFETLMVFHGATTPGPGERSEAFAVQEKNRLSTRNYGARQSHGRIGDMGPVDPTYLVRPALWTREQQ